MFTIIVNIKPNRSNFSILTSCLFRFGISNPNHRLLQPQIVLKRTFQSKMHLYYAKILFFFIAAHCKPLYCEVIHVDRVFSFSWRVPCLPVMTLEFVKILFKHGSAIENGVVIKTVALCGVLLG